MKGIVLALLLCLASTQSRAQMAGTPLSDCWYEYVQARQQCANEALVDQVFVFCSSALIICGCALMPSPATLFCAAGCAAGSLTCSALFAGSFAYYLYCANEADKQRRACEAEAALECI